MLGKGGDCASKRRPAIARCGSSSAVFASGRIAFAHGMRQRVELFLAAVAAIAAASLQNCGLGSGSASATTAQWRRQLERETNLAVDVKHEVHLIVLAPCHQTIHCAQRAPKHRIADAEHGAQSGQHAACIGGRCGAVAAVSALTLVEFFSIWIDLRDLECVLEQHDG